MRRLDRKQRIHIFGDWWFDATRHVRTVGYAKPEAATIVGEVRDSYDHVPIRVANAREALRDLPIRDFSDYTFIDMGSGKGRMLFIAAEYPFRKVMGVEFSTVLHPQAQENIKRYRHRKRQCGEIESVCADAAEFEFPEEKLVVYMFNPFGPEVMGRMLANLESLGGVVHSGEVLLALTKAGILREDAYRIVQTAAMQTWTRLGTPEGRSFRANLEADPATAERVQPADLEAAMDPALHLRSVDRIFARVFV